MSILHAVVRGGESSVTQHNATLGPRDWDPREWTGTSSLSCSS